MRYAAIAFTILVALAAMAATDTPSTFSDLACFSSDSLNSRGASIGSAFRLNVSTNCFDQNPNASIALLLSDEDEGGEDEGKDEKDQGDEKKEEDTGPDRIWGAAKFG